MKEHAPSDQPKPAIEGSAPVHRRSVALIGLIALVVIAAASVRAMPDAFAADPAGTPSSRSRAARSASNTPEPTPTATLAPTETPAPDPSLPGTLPPVPTAPATLAPTATSAPGSHPAGTSAPQAIATATSLNPIEEDPHNQRVDEEASPTIPLVPEGDAGAPATPAQEPDDTAPALGTPAEVELPDGTATASPEPHASPDAAPAEPTEGAKEPVTVEAFSAGSQVTPGDTKTYRFRVQNVGDATRRVRLIASNTQPGWIATVYAADGATPITTPVTIPAGDSVDVLVQVSVPYQARAGDRNTTTLDALLVDQLDCEVSGSCTED